MTTKKRIAEQVLRRHKGGHVGAEVEIDERELYIFIGQLINEKLRTRRFDKLAEDDRFPENLMLAVYESVPVVQYRDRAATDLPTFPVSLPRDMGVWRVAPENNMDALMVPMSSSQYAMVKGRVAGLFEGRFGYELIGRKIVFTKDITADGIDNVYLELVVVDVDSLSDVDPLPITPDMEAEIIIALLTILKNDPLSDKKVDNRDEQ